MPLKEYILPLLFLWGFPGGPDSKESACTLLIATGEAIPLRGLEGVPGLPGAPQDEAGLTRMSDSL